MDVNANSNMTEVMSSIEKIFQVIDKYEPSRPGSLGFTKLEEAILWIQVMVQQIPLKTIPVADEKKDEVTEAA